MIWTQGTVFVLVPAAKVFLFLFTLIMQQDLIFSVRQSEQIKSSVDLISVLVLKANS